MDECRKQFEDWVTVSGEFPKAAERSKDGGYKLMQTHIVWSGWEAAWNRAAQQWQPIETAPKEKGSYLCRVNDNGSCYTMVLDYGFFSFVNEDFENPYPDEDEEGYVKRHGWHYERDSEGEYDSLLFDMNSKVTHWMPLPAAPEETR